MPTKLESLQAEQKRLAARKNLSPQDDKRLQTLTRLIREEKRKHDPTPGKVYRETTVSKTTGKVGSVGRWGTTAGTAYTRDQLRTEFGMAPLGDLLNRDGDTGEVSLNPRLNGYRFGPDTTKPGLSGKGGAMASGALKSIYANTPGDRGMGAMNGMSAKDMLDFYYSMNDGELVKFQAELADAGLVEKPILGVRDPSTTEALGNLMKLWMAEPNTPINELMARLKKANAARLADKVKEQFGGGVGVVSDEVANVTITDAETLNSLVDRMSTELMGSFVDPATKANLIKQIQDEQAQRKIGAAKSDFEAKARSTPQGSASAELDQFMDALIGKESGGDAGAINPDSGAIGLGQIMPENWGPWAAEAGADPRDFSAANQRKIIKYKLAQYYATYGNWRDVALVWYGGEGGRQRAAAGGGNATEYYGGNAYDSLNQYADSVIAKMNANTGVALLNGQQQGNLTVNVQEDITDPQTRIETELRRLDPARYQATQVAKRAATFFNLLGGVQ